MIYTICCGLFGWNYKFINLLFYMAYYIESVVKYKKVDLEEGL